METHDSILKNFNKHGFNSLTVIQKKGISLLSNRVNCLLAAPTGSGKTEAAIIPIITLLSMKKPQNNGIKAIYVTPLRSLNNDVLRRITKYANSENLEVEIRHGDSSASTKKRIKDNPPDILITTPESLSIILTIKKIIDAMKSLEWIIIDEIHEVFPNERGIDLSLCLERLQLVSSNTLVRVGLSATIGNLRETAKFLVGKNNKCAIIVDKSKREYDLDVKFIPGSLNDISIFIIDYVTKLNSNGSILLFTNTRDEAEYLGSHLKRNSSFSIDIHHGSLSKILREETESKLRTGKTEIVVCTSSLELGLDIGSVELVIQYGSPRQISKLMQRIGRSRHAKRLSAKGLLVTNIYDDKLEILSLIRNMKKGLMEEFKMHENSLDVLAHHIVGMVLQNKDYFDIKYVYDIFTKSYPFRKLSFSDFESCLDLLDRNKIILYSKEEQRYTRRIKSYKYYYETYSSIPDFQKFSVVDSISKRMIGTLDQKFVGDYGEKGNIFVLKGSQWKILSIDESRFEIYVEPLFGGTINIPHWIGEMIPVDYIVAKEVGIMRNDLIYKQTESDVLSPIHEFYDLYKVIPDQNNLVVEHSRLNNSLVIHSTFGTKINNTLATLFSTLLSSKLGYVVETKSDAYRILLSSTARISLSHLKEVFNDEYLDLYSILVASFSGTYQINWKVWSVAKRFGMIEKKAVYDKKIARMIYDRYSKTPVSKESIRELIHDKYDLENTFNIIHEIKIGNLKLHWFDATNFSKLCNPILEHSKSFSSHPVSIQKGLLELLKERLKKTKQKLICIRCGKWNRVFSTNDLQDKLICPLCKSHLITCTYWSDTELSNIITKKISGKNLTSDENHKFDRAWKVASLINNFGKYAVIVMSGYGIGADTAARILRDYIDEDELYKQIFNAERQYIMTRNFWKD